MFIDFKSVPLGEEDHDPLCFRAPSLFHTLSVPLELHQWDGQCWSSHLHALAGKHMGIGHKDKCMHNIGEVVQHYLSFLLRITHLQEDSLDQSLSTMSVSMTGNNVYEAARLSGGSSIMENLQSQLKLREGEIAQLQVAI